MPETLFHFLGRIDTVVAAAAGLLMWPLAAYILISGADDLVLDLLWLRRLVAGRKAPPAAPGRERLIAVFLPLWHESAVIEAMIEHNLAAISYGNYEVFAGVYANDPETRGAVERLARRHPRVHVAEVGHNGPTSKADCLNWVYQSLLEWEEREGRRAELIVIHDAEDLIHPYSFEAINRYSGVAGMIQVPVLALPTGWRELTHGVYCDDFAESQGKDLETRVEAGGFLPGCGVGTAFRREELDRLAGRESNRLFDPESLTEDYDNGLRLFSLGCRQAFLPLAWRHGTPVSTREYFPRAIRAAVRQRTRWITGNALQAWEKHGWGTGLRGRWVQTWFFWRDRKGLWGNPVSLLCNGLMLWGVLEWCAGTVTESLWRMGGIGGSRALRVALGINLALLLERLAVRMVCSARVYGWRFAAGVPVRMVWGNWINAWAGLRAVWQYGRSKALHEPLRWLKTEHAYPGREALAVYKQRLEDILVSNGWCEAGEMNSAIQLKPDGMQVGEYLVERGLIGERDYYAALSLQHNLPLAPERTCPAESRIARMLPEKLAQRLDVIPLQVRGGALEVGTVRVPDDGTAREVARFTRLPVRFCLLPRWRYERLASRLNGGSGQGAPLHLRRDGQEAAVGSIGIRWPASAGE